MQIMQRAFKIRHKNFKEKWTDISSGRYLQWKSWQMLLFRALAGQYLGQYLQHAFTASYVFNNTLNHS